MNSVHSARTAYASVDNPVGTARGNEYKALARATHLLTQASSPDAPFTTIAEALHLNRRLWTVLAEAVADNGNLLPRPLRAQIYFLSQFSIRQSRIALRDTSQISSIIEINRSLMRGLRLGEK